MLADQFANSWEELVNFDRLRGYRVGRVTQALSEAGLDGLIAFKSDSVRYITSLRPLTWEAGYQTRNLAIVSRSGDVCLYVASGDYQRVVDNDPWLKTVRPLASMEDAGISLRVVKDNLVPQLKEMGLLGGRLAADATTFYTEDYVRRAVKERGTELEDGEEVMRKARALKSSDEMRLMQVAAGMVDGGLFEAQKAIRAGRTENMVAGAAVRAMYALGTEWMPVNPVVFSGRGPFRRYSTGKTLKGGELVVVNMTAMNDGYCAESTRTFPVGRTKASSLWATLREAYDESVAMLEPGTRLTEISAEFARRTASKGRFEFGIRGAGLSLAELPDSRSSGQVLEAGMALVIEARAEDPKAGTAQISDTIQIDSSGPSPMTRFQGGL